MPTTNVALLGLGIMGSGMGLNILTAGFPLTVYNRIPAKARPLAEHGAVIAATPREAAAGAQIIVSMVGNDDASRAVRLGDDRALAAAAEDAVLAECSTLSAAWSRELAALAQERGLAFLGDADFAAVIEAIPQ